MYQLTVAYLLLLVFSNQFHEFPCNWEQKCTFLNSTIILRYLIRNSFHIMLIYFFKRKASGILDERTDLSLKRCWWSFLMLINFLKGRTLVLSLSGVFGKTLVLSLSGLFKCVTSERGYQSQYLDI